MATKLSGVNKVLLGAIVTIAVLYVTAAGTYVTRADVSRMIEVESPYVQDKKWLRTQLETMDKKLDKILSKE